MEEFKTLCEEHGRNEAQNTGSNSRNQPVATQTQPHTSSETVDVGNNNAQNSVSKSTNEQALNNKSE